MVFNIFSWVLLNITSQKLKQFGNGIKQISGLTPRQQSPELQPHNTLKVYKRNHHAGLQWDYKKFEHWIQRNQRAEKSKKFEQRIQMNQSSKRTLNTNIQRLKLLGNVYWHLTSRAPPHHQRLDKIWYTLSKITAQYG